MYVCNIFKKFPNSIAPTSYANDLKLSLEMMPGVNYAQWGCLNVSPTGESLNVLFLLAESQLSSCRWEMRGTNATQTTCADCVYLCAVDAKQVP